MLLFLILLAESVPDSARLRSSVPSLAYCSPSLRVPLLGVLEDVLTAAQNRLITAVLALRWRNEFQAAVLVLMVVLLHKFPSPLPRFLHGAEQFPVGICRSGTATLRKYCRCLPLAC